MKNSAPGLLIVGFLAGAVVAGGAMLALGGREGAAPERRPGVAATDGPRDRALMKENRLLREEVAALKARLKERPADVDPALPAEKDDLPEDSDLDKEFAALVKQGFMGLQGEKARAFLQRLKKEGAGGREFLLKVLRQGKTAAERLIAAGFLEGLKDPGAVPELARLLPLEQDMIVRRMISHALAVIGTPGAQPPLRSAMTTDADWGVRVNSAYGVAKQGGADGLRYLEEAYVSADTPAEYRLAILGGLADVAALETAPMFRRILQDTTDAGYLLLAIGALEKMKDGEAVGALEGIASSDLPPSVKEAARKAVDAIRNP